MPFATANLPGLITTYLILPHPILMAIACCLHIIMNGHRLCFHSITHPHAPACHCLPLISPEHSNDGEEELRAIDNSEHFSQKSHYIDDDTGSMHPLVFI
jgi:hypothetical protein